METSTLISIIMTPDGEEDHGRCSCERQPEGEAVAKGVVHELVLCIVLNEVRQLVEAERSLRAKLVS
jgi:hypothetical protein